MSDTWFVFALVLTLAAYVLAWNLPTRKSGGSTHIHHHHSIVQEPLEEAEKRGFKAGMERAAVIAETSTHCARTRSKVCPGHVALIAEVRTSDEIAQAIRNEIV